MEKKNQNRETWCGYRPSVMPAKKKNKKRDRKEGKQICRNAMKGEKEWKTFFWKILMENTLTLTRASANPFTALVMVGTAFIITMEYAMSATRWKNVMIGECFGNRGRNGKTVSSP